MFLTLPKLLLSPLEWREILPYWQLLNITPPILTMLFMHCKLHSPITPSDHSCLREHMMRVRMHHSFIEISCDRLHRPEMQMPQFVRRLLKPLVYILSFRFIHHLKMFDFNNLATPLLQ